MGFEPMMRVLQTLALPLGDVAGLNNILAGSQWLALNQTCQPFAEPERAMGFEPTTFSLARRRTTAVLRPHLFG